MQLKDQVCAYDLAQKLKELGCRQDTAFAWLTGYKFPVLGGHYGSRFECAAYSTAELGVMLSYNGLLLNHTVSNELAEWEGVIKQYNPTTENIDSSGWEQVEQFKGPTEADVRAAMLIYSLDSEGMNADDINKALGPYIAQ